MTFWPVVLAVIVALIVAYLGLTVLGWLGGLIRAERYSSGLTAKQTEHSYRRLTADDAWSVDADGNVSADD